MKLKNKVAIITGASRGIGKATALLFAKNGAKVVVNYLNSKEKAEEVVKKIKEFGSDAISIRADVSKEDDVQWMVDETMRVFRRIDVLVNNAGVFYYKDSFHFDKDIWEKTIDTNLKGTLFCIQKVSKIMLAQKTGVIVNVSSISGTTIWGMDTVEYISSKSSINALTRHFAIKLGPHIRVNCVAPSNTDTDMGKLSDDFRIAYIKKTPLKRRAEPGDIAKVILFLASDDSDILTGQVIVADGGFSLDYFP